MNEWKPITDFPGYEVSYLGLVRGPLKSLTLRPDRKGYLFANMRRGGLVHKRTVSRLVAEAFVGPCPAGQQVRHKNGIKSDDHFSNLEYGTQADNEHDKRRHGTAPIGVNHPCAKLNESQVSMIRTRYIPYHPTHGASAIGREFGLSQNTISKIVNRKLWGHVA